jgi:hypothetical protein
MSKWTMTTAAAKRIALKCTDKQLNGGGWTVEDVEGWLREEGFHSEAGAYAVMQLLDEWGRLFKEGLVLELAKALARQRRDHLQFINSAVNFHGRLLEYSMKDQFFAEDFRMASQKEEEINV